MKHLKILLILLAVLALSVGLTACVDNPSSSEQTFATVTFSYGASTDKVTTSVFSVGHKITVPQDVKPEDGKIIVGWYKDHDCSEGNEWNFETDTVKANMILYAKLEDVKPHSVTFVYGAQETDVIVKSVMTGEKTVAPDSEIEAEIGSVIEGWYKDYDCTVGQEWNFENDTVYGDTILYAKWGECEITVAQALQIIGELEPSVSAAKTYLIRGTLSELTNTQYGQGTLTDATGSVMIYGLYSADGALHFDKLEERPSAGDELLLRAELQNYKGTKAEIVKGYILEIKKKERPVLNYEELYDTEITIAKAIEIGEYIADGETTTGRFIVKATVKSIVNSNFGSMVITDGTNEIYVYGSYDALGEKRYPELENQPYKDDEVTLSVNLKNFKGEAEINSAWILEVKKAEINVDENDYTPMTVLQARDADTGAKIKVSGVVARITYANGKIPSGFYLIDNTNSIYVYDSQIAARVEIGNTLTILAEKTYWILEDEKKNAEKFGYKGCNQLENVYLLENDEQTSSFDKSWISESTVKEVISTPVTTDISTTIFKVNALIKRVNGEGFVNYYFDDIDGKTGSYAYTQCNGSDFDWLDAYDGKICTVYLSALNAKSTNSGCGWRFIPVEVIDEGYVFDKAQAGKYAVVYHAIDQFIPTYKADPAIQVLTSVSSELLGIENVELTYSSSDNKIVYFENGIMHTKNAGVAVITITGCLQGYEPYSQELTITVAENVEIESITVGEAISAEVGSEVTVKGIVGPSTVNQTGFYLVGEDGIIAIRTTKAEMEDVHLGDEVVLKGTRVQILKEGKTGSGQACIDGSVILANSYGQNEYSIASFDTTKTLADLKQVTIDEDYTAKAFVLTGKIVETQYKYSIEDENGNSFDLYAGGKGQYSWLSEYVGQTITVEIALCNWNSKTYYACCVLAIYTQDGTKVVNQLNLAK